MFFLFFFFFFSFKYYHVYHYDWEANGRLSGFQTVNGGYQIGSFI